jgi:hypothetical protein
MSRVIDPHPAHHGLVAAARFTANGERPLRMDAAHAALTAAHALLTEERDGLAPGYLRDDLSEAVRLMGLALWTLGGGSR